MRSKPRVAVGDHAGEHVEPAGRAFRIGGGRDVGRQRQAFEQRHDVDAAGLQHRAVGRARSRAASVRRCARRPWCAARAGSSRARDRRRRRAAGRGSPAGSGRARTRSAGRIPPLFASAAIMWSGRMPLVPLASGTTSRLAAAYAASIYPKAALTGRRAGSYEPHLSRGHLSRPACSHVKQRC